MLMLMVEEWEGWEKEGGERVQGWGTPLVREGCRGNEPNQPVAVVLAWVHRIWKCAEGGSGIHQFHSRRKKRLW